MHHEGPQQTQDWETPPPGWLDILAGVLFSPRATFERVAQQPPLGLGVLVLVLVYLVNSVVQIRGVTGSLAGDLTGIPEMPGFALDPGALAGPVMLFMLVAGGLIAFTTIALIHLGAGLLGGTGHGRAMTALAGLAFLPVALEAPVTLLAEAGVRGLWPASLAIYLWNAYLLYRAVRAVHRLPRWRAVAALLTPFVMLLLALVPALYLFGAVFVEVLQQFGDLPLP